MNGLCNVNSLKTLNRAPTCFKNPNNPSYFQQTYVIETGISDFHKMIVTVMKTHYKKQKHIRANNSNYITKALQKEIMHRS